MNSHRTPKKGWHKNLNIFLAFHFCEIEQIGVLEAFIGEPVDMGEWRYNTRTKM